MPQDSPSRRQQQFVVRLPDGMRERIAGEAEAAGRSMNAEIVARLQQTFDKSEIWHDEFRRVLQEELADPNYQRLQAEHLEYQKRMHDQITRMWNHILALEGHVVKETKEPDAA